MKKIKLKDTDEAKRGREIAEGLRRAHERRSGFGAVITGRFVGSLKAVFDELNAKEIGRAASRW